jgi:hypothetical protein
MFPKCTGPDTLAGVGRAEGWLRKLNDRKFSRLTSSFQVSTALRTGAAEISFGLLEGCK